MANNPVSIRNLIGSEPDYVAPAQRASVTINPEMQQAVNELFKDLCAAFPAWRNAFLNTEMYKSARRLWLETLIDEQITAQQVQAGLAVAKRSANPFFPSVGQFVEWCRQGNKYSSLGLPTPDGLIASYDKFRSSFYENPEDYPWQNAVEYHLVLQLKRAIYQGNLDEAKTLTRAKTLIADMAKRLQSGEKIAEPKTIKIEVKQGSLSQAEIYQRAEAARAILGRKK